MPRKIIPLSEEEEIIANNYYNWLLADIYSINTYRLPIEKFLLKKLNKNEFDEIKAKRVYYEYCYKNSKRFQHFYSIYLRAEILRNVANKFVQDFVFINKK